MAFELSYWVKHFGVDGFSCANVANVPADYWDRITAQVNADAPSKLFWLADSYTASASKNSFAAGYNVPLFQTLNQLGAGKLTPAQVVGSVSASLNVPSNNLFVNYTNTDILSDIIGSDVTRLGAATKLGSVLAFTSPGVPMIYNGQEVGLTTKLKAYDKSTIKWPAADTSQPYSDFYKNLILLRKNNSALGLSGTTISSLKTSSKTVFAFVRKSGSNRVLVIGNLSAKPIKKVVITTDSITGSYFNFDTAKAVSVAKTMKLKLPKFGYVVLSSQLAG
jgi:glycosidase